MSVAGTWNVTVQTPMGAQSGTMTVAVDGESFSGMLSNPMMGSMAVENGRVAGNTLNWTMALTTPMAMTLDATATVDGDTLSGSVKAGVFGSMDLSGTRG